MRPTALRSASPRLGSIELCRGIAAVLVVLFHSSIILGQPKNFGAPPFQNFSNFGRSGVDFFFVLSGFLIAMLHWRDIGHPAVLRRYTIRRLTRIYPTYWLVLLAVVPSDIFRHTLFDHYDQPIEVLKAIFLFPQDQPILDVTWSLGHELLFYALFGAAIFRRGLGVPLAILWLIALGLAWWIGTPSDNMAVQAFIRPLNIEFFAGVAAGWAFGRFKIYYAGRILAFGLIGFMALWACDDLLWPAQPDVHLVGMRSLGYSAAAAAVIFGLSSLEIRGRFTVPKFFVTLGGASYLLYLMHVPALLVMGLLSRGVDRHRFGPDWAIALVYTAVVVAGTTAMHCWIERPMLRALRGRKPVSLVPDTAKVSG